MRKPQKGGILEAERRLLYATWTQQARLKFQKERTHTIFPTMQAVGLCNSMDGSEDNLIAFKEGKGTADMSKFLPLSRWKKADVDNDDEWSDDDESSSDSIIVFQIPVRKKTQLQRKVLKKPKLKNIPKKATASASRAGRASRAQTPERSSSQNSRSQQSQQLHPPLPTPLPAA